MISAVLKGGLGNQLFQIATTYALALRNNDIACFNLETCYTPLQGKPSYNYKTNILNKVNNVTDFIYSGKYNEPKFSYQELPYSKNVLLDGYFQSEKYFIDFKEEIIDLFELPLDSKTKVKEFFNWWGVNDKPISSIHIRRGDYLKNPNFHSVCPIEYYKKAMENIGDSYFIFISDDMNWVKDNFKGNNVIYSTFNDEIDDLTLMTLCDNNIIANSSFSWWGAYLNRNKNKKVIAPKEWFGPMGPNDTNDIIPLDWTII